MILNLFDQAGGSGASGAGVGGTGQSTHPPGVTGICIEGAGHVQEQD